MTLEVKNVLYASSSRRRGSRFFNYQKILIQMLDIKWIRENPEKFDAAMQKRSATFKASDILTLDEEKRKKISIIQELQTKRNKFAQEMAEAKKKSGFNNAVKSFGPTAEAGWASSEIAVLLAAGRNINEELAAAENNFSVDEKLNELLATIPNVPHDSVPVGSDENHNVEIEKFGEPRKFSFTPKAHDEIGEALGMLDFEQSALMSGARFSTLSGGLAQLERALSNFMLDVALENNYREVSPPNLVKSEAMRFSGQLPKFAEEAFSTSDGYWLIPTSEVSLVNLVAKKTLLESELPLRFTAYTPCFLLVLSARDILAVIEK